ncbi:MAG: HPP family protein [Nitrosomonadales bacterium]|nr:HPP family protein [Nitrosomonadales bacterium]
MDIKNTIKSFRPNSLPASFAEKARSGFAGGLAIFLLAWALYHLPQPEYPLLLLGSMAASAVLLFAVPHSPLAQPWNLIGGHFVSALAGWTAIHLVADPVTAAGVAVGSAIFLMYLLNCLHPPGAATALTLVLGAPQFQQMGWHWVALIVAANAGIFLLLALIINNSLPQRRYPAMSAKPPPPLPETTIIPEQEDLEWALGRMDSMIDINIEDLNSIYAAAHEHAQSRFDSRIK